MKKLFTFLSLFISLSILAQDEPKVVGGVEVDIKDYPWQIALTSSPNGSGFCGGSIIGNSWVLTAAHCVNGDSPNSVYVRVGSSNAFASGGTSYSLNNIIVHPNYSGNSYDFALLEINGEFNYNENVQKIDLVTAADIAAGVQDPGVIATITGWGTTSSGGSLSSTLMMVEAPIVSNDVACGAATDENGNSGDYGCSSLDESMICAGDLINGGEDACQGDSGGPLAVRNSDNTKWLLIGATSWGYGCAYVDYPGVWSKVSYVLDWINSNAETNSEYGCMDETACNYDPEAIYDDGSCAEIDECGDCGGSGPLPGYDCEGNCITGETLVVEMLDSYGDGWNGNNLIINGTSLTIENGSSGNGVVCYDSSINCIDVTCNGGTWQSEVSWTISDENGNQLLSGGAPFDGNIGNCGGASNVLGCTDELALNYNPLATENDGSCEYDQSDLLDCQGQDYSGYESWLGDGYCDDGTYGIYFNCEQFDFDNGDCDIIIDYGACTDPNALNFDPNATFDDGSCQYNNSDCTEQYDAGFYDAQSIPITLNEGWNMIGYTRHIPQDVAATLESISEYIVIAKDAVGNAYLPDWGFNGIGDFTPGLGYQIKVTQEFQNYILPDVGELRLILTPTTPDWAKDLPTYTHPNDIRTLIRVVNELGQEVNPLNQFNGSVLFYIYNDGTVEKHIK